MPFQIVRNDITRMKADVIVNSANPQPTFGSGSDSAVYKAAGIQELLAARKRIGNIAPGQAAVTPAFRLQAKHIIHTVGPLWQGGSHGEMDVLRACYRNSLHLADDLHAESIAFPLISTGTYQFPREEALNIALSEIGKFLMTHERETEMQVYLVVFDPDSFALSSALMGDIQAFIAEHTVAELRDEEYARPSMSGRDRRRPRPSISWDTVADMAPMDAEAERTYRASFHQMPGKRPPLAHEADQRPALQKISLDDMLKKKQETFQKRLFQLIDERGLTDAMVYKKANLDRKHFSKIRCSESYVPQKNTVIALALALELDLNDTQDLLRRAGYAFSPSKSFDLIVTYCIDRKIYDIYEVNAVLFKFNEKELGTVH